MIVESLPGWPLDSLRALRRRVPDVPWVLVTSGVEPNLVELAKIEVEEVVLLSRAARLPAVVREARAQALRLRMAQSVSDLEWSDLYLRDLFRALFLAPAPARTAAEWGRLIGRQSSTVLHHLGRCHAQGGPSAPVAINFNLVLAAWEAAPSARTWRALAAAVDVDERRFRRTASLLLPRVGGDFRRVPRPRAFTRSFLGLLEAATGVAPLDS
jgi:hypothetical protein